MKKQINPTIKAYLIRGAFYLLLFLGVCAIPFALAQSRSRGTSKQSTQFPKAPEQSQPLALPGGVTPTPTPTPVCTPTYTLTLGGGVPVAGVTDIGSHCDNCGTAITLPFPVTLYDQTFTTATAGSNGHLTFGTPYDGTDITCSPFGNTIATYVMAPSWAVQYTTYCIIIYFIGCGI